MPPSYAPDSNPSSARWEQRIAWAALGLVLAAALLDALRLHPGFATYDEEGPLAAAQAWLEGQSLSWRFAQGSLHRALLAGCLRWLGPGLLAARLPALLAVAAEGPLLWAWARPRLGGRAALWAALALAVSGATLMRARMLVSPALLPALFLAHAVWLDRLKRPWQHALFGASLALWLLDYDGWMLGLAVLLPLWLAPVWRARPRRAALATLVGAALLLAAGLATGALPAWWRTREAVSWADGGPGSMALANLGSLLAGGHRLAFSAIEGWPWPAPWTWPLALLGSAALIRRWPASAWLALVGAAPLGLADSGAEPHRLALLQVALALAAGVGAAWMLARARWRALPLLLLVVGGGAELHAFLTRDAASFQAAYGRSQGLMAASRWLRQQSPPQGWDVIDGLGPYDDGPFRLLLDADSVRRSGGRPVALIHADYLPAVAGVMPVQAVGAGASALFLAFPAPGQLDRLRAVSGLAAPLDAATLHEHPRRMQESCRLWLGAPGHGDPWARTVAWEQWLHASLQSRQVDLGGVHALLGEPLVSGWGLDVLAHELALQGQADLAARCTQKAVTVDPRRATWADAERRARY